GPRRGPGEGGRGEKEAEESQGWGKGKASDYRDRRGRPDPGEEEGGSQDPTAQSAPPPGEAVHADGTPYDRRGHQGFLCSPGQDVAGEPQAEVRRECAQPGRGTRLAGRRAGGTQAVVHASLGRRGRPTSVIGW